MKTNPERIANILEKYLEKVDIEGVCGFFVDRDDEDKIQVVLVLDIDFIKDAPMRSDLFSAYLRSNVKNKIKDFLGFENIKIGSTARKCDQK